jgi:tricorn protease
VENHGVSPDVEVLISPDDWSADHDPQLEVAVNRALEALAAQATPPVPAPPPSPSKRRPPLPPRTR